MYVKLFLLGRPGCGKSRTARHLTEFVKSFSWTTQRFKDYDILAEMAKTDTRFRLLDNGFDILKGSAFDDALHILDDNVRKYCQNIETNQPNTNQLIIIELARSNYDDAFKHFTSNMLDDASFLLIDVEFGKCKDRIKKRIASPEPNTNDNHFVSDYAMDKFYKEQHLPQDSAISLTIFTNNGSWDNFTHEVEPFIQRLLKIH
ncbi:MAG TPA: hypothetical protein DHW02_09035 [Ktedonobacter sp.]|nr:hypothetical protein [Ktedonobacter sp.]